MATTPPLTAALTAPTHAVTLTISNQCSCRFCPQCAIPFSGTACACGQEGFPDMECRGCTADACEHVGIIAQQWYLANPARGARWDVHGGLEDALAGMEGPWEQRWRIEPWRGGVMEVEVLAQGRSLGCWTVRP